MKLTKKIIKAIETKTNCSVNFDEKRYYIYVDNACGEDFSIDIYRGGREVENIIEDCDLFDPQEHFRLWYGANNGEPQDPRVLLDNCDEIAKNLKQLADLLRGFVK